MCQHVAYVSQHFHHVLTVVYLPAQALSSDGGVGDALQPRDAPTDRDPSAGTRV